MFASLLQVADREFDGCLSCCCVPKGDKTNKHIVRHDETVASVLDKVNAVLNNGFNGFNGPLISQREGLLLEHETTMEMLSDLKKVLVDPSAGTAEFKFKET